MMIKISFQFTIHRPIRHVSLHRAMMIQKTLIRAVQEPINILTIEHMYENICKLSKHKALKAKNECSESIFWILCEILETFITKDTTTNFTSPITVPEIKCPEKEHLLEIFTIVRRVVGIFTVHPPH